MEIVSLIVDFLLFCLTLFVFAKKPSAKKFLLLVVLISAVHIAQIVFYAQSAGLSVYDYFMDSYKNVLSQLGTSISSIQKEQALASLQVFSACWVSMYVMQSAGLVCIALLLEWTVKKVGNKKSQWGAFSKLDLSIWTVIPLILGILMLVLSWIPQLPYSDVVYSISLNVLIISTLPLYAQGGAAFKGILNRANASLALQIILMFCGILTGLAFLITPLLGLIDYWANFRKLPRDASDAK